MAKKWTKCEPRPRSQKFRCPNCGKICFCQTKDGASKIICDYSFCPYCGKEVQPDEVEL